MPWGLDTDASDRGYSWFWLRAMGGSQHLARNRAPSLDRGISAVGLAAMGFVEIE